MTGSIDHPRVRARRVSAAVSAALTTVLLSACQPGLPGLAHGAAATVPTPAGAAAASSALRQLAGLAVHPRAPLKGYSRSAFGPTWPVIDGCDARDRVGDAGSRLADVVNQVASQPRLVALNATIEARGPGNTASPSAWSPLRSSRSQSRLLARPAANPSLVRSASCAAAAPAMTTSRATLRPCARKNAGGATPRAAKQSSGSGLDSS